MRRHFRVALVEPPGAKNYLPTATAFLAAYARKEQAVRDDIAFRLHLGHAGDSSEDAFSELLSDGVPDIVAFSCQGWAVPYADELAERVRNLSPRTLIVYGGNHVTSQGAAFFAARPYLDVLGNGEGEATFAELLMRFLDHPTRPDLRGVAGLSYRAADGSIVDNPDRPRLVDLGTIPSPLLEGLLPVPNGFAGTVLLESNRGCPYSCSFCYWGTAVQTRVRRFPVDRTLEELRFLALRGVDSIFICDANFGMFPEDEKIVDYIVELRRTHGVPRCLHTNWAKHSNERIVRMCAHLNAAGTHSTFTLAAQSTTETALKLSNRINMKINRLGELGALCRQHNVIPRGELIWGLPGETFDEFLRSYDDVAAHTDALSVYPHYLLPNTRFAEDAEKYGLVAEKGDFDTDYAYCVEHAQMTRDDFERGLRFIISNNLLRVGSTFFQLFPRAAHQFAGVRYSRTVLALETWIEKTKNAMARRFKPFYRRPLAMHRQSLGEVWSAIAERRADFLEMMVAYVTDTFIQSSDTPPEARPILQDALRWDTVTFPIYDDCASEDATSGPCYERSETFAWDWQQFLMGFPLPSASPTTVQIKYRKGLWRYPRDNWYFGLLGFRGAPLVRDPSHLSVVV